MLALLAPIVYADSGKVCKVGNFEGKLFERLTDNQNKQLKAIWEKQEAAKKAAIVQLKVDKEDLTNELLETTPDMNKIKDLKAKIEALMSKILDDRINSNLEVKKILNNEQFAKYLEFQNHKFHGHHEHHVDWGKGKDVSSSEHHSHWDSDGDNE